MIGVIKIEWIVTKFKTPIKLRMGVCKSWRKNKKIIPFIIRILRIFRIKKRIPLIHQASKNFLRNARKISSPFIGVPNL